MNFKTSSQYGECAVLHAHFLGRPPGYFIDIGAADGIRYSNTLNLINNDWSGILIEPCHHFLKTLESNYFEHDKVKIFPGAISNYDGTSKLKNSDLWKNEGEFTDEYWVDVLKPTSLLKKFDVPNYIEFVDIDAEASEMDILNSWPWDDYEVEIFCIEFSPGVEALTEFMAQKGYVPWIKTGGNLLFCQKENFDTDEFKGTISRLSIK